MRKILFFIPLFLWTCGGGDSSPTEPSISEIQNGKMYGGRGNDRSYDAKQTSDGGFILAGYTDSFGAGDYDMYIVKTDYSGNEMWSQTFGGSELDIAYSVEETSDGGFTLLGLTNSFGNGCDMYLVKTNASGNEMWSQTFGGSGCGWGYSVQETSDGGLILAGHSRSGGNGDYDYDMYLVKTDYSGNEMWSQTFGGSERDMAYSVEQTSDGGFILAGKSDNGLYLVKTDASGNEMWSQTFGAYPVARSVEQTSDGGFILSAGSMRLLKTDASGNEMWSQAFEGHVSGGNVGSFDALAISDGGYIIAGYTQIDISGHVGYDMYVVKNR